MRGWLVIPLLVMLGLAQQAPVGPFSHKKHAGLKLKCSQCHASAEKAERAGFPAPAGCRTCHTQMAPRAIPEQRVYELRDFVIFSHGRHAEAKLNCASCHGEVNAMDKVEVVRSTKMASCMDCHREHRATLECNVCHELGQ
jgi:hypothetical protein